MTKEGPPVIAFGRPVLAEEGRLTFWVRVLRKDGSFLHAFALHDPETRQVYYQSPYCYWLPEEAMKMGREHARLRMASNADFEPYVRDSMRGIR